VLLGLAVDYAVVHYQEALAHPQLSVPEIRRPSRRAFFGGHHHDERIPGFESGGLPRWDNSHARGIGVGLAALVMVMIYLPRCFPIAKSAAVPSAD